MTRSFTFRVPPDLYEVIVRDHIIVRLTKYMGESQFPRECTVAELPERAREILVELLTSDEDDES